MFCNHCGQQMPPGSQYCSRCGAPLWEPQTFSCPRCGRICQPDQTVCPQCGLVFTPPCGQAYSQNFLPRSRLVAGLLAVLLGSFGIHNFYLGYTGKGVAQVLLSTVGALFTCGLSALGVYIWAFTEGVLIFSGSINFDAHGVPLRD